MKKIILVVLNILFLINFVVASSADIAVTSLVRWPQNPRVNDTLYFNYTIINYGPDAANISFSDRISYPGGGLGNAGCCISLFRGQTFNRTASYIAPVAGLYNFTATGYSIDTYDPNPSNDRASLLFNVIGGGVGSPSFLKIKAPRVYQPSPEETNWGVLLFGIVALILIFFTYRNFSAMRQNQSRRINKDRINTRRRP